MKSEMLPYVPLLAETKRSFAADHQKSKLKPGHSTAPYPDATKQCQVPYDLHNLFNYPSQDQELA